METLIATLRDECDAYDGLLSLSRKKTPVIITGDLNELTKITEEEQEYAGRIQNLEKKRVEVTADIANVVNRDVNKLKLKDLIEMLEARPSEQRALIEIHDRLHVSVHELKRVNEQNAELLSSSLEMVQYEITLLQAMKAAPETANYSKGTYTGETMGISRGGFDAKQ
ncbi:MAG: flagellar protein FlgN [Lachnospiraceae bacterium]|nr:flagellar protein FlgN [Lachnospiraceae bacterium]